MNYPGAPHLTIEIVLDLVMAALALLLIVRAQDNRLRLIWGAMVLLFSLSMLRDNYRWLGTEPLIVRDSLTLLSIPIMIKWYLFVHALSLFTLGSLRPEWVTPTRLAALSQPPILACTVVACYLWFDGYITPLHSTAQIVAQIGHTDVQLRLGLFLLSVLTPTLTLLAPLVYKFPQQRRRSRGMCIYIACFALMLAAYLLFVLAANRWAVYAFGYIVTTLPIYLSVLYLRDENPLSLPRNVGDTPAQTPEIPEVTSSDITAYKLFDRIDSLMKTDTPFTDPDYTLRKLAQQVGASCTLTMRAVKWGGFTGFHEYVNFLRLEHFKLIADRMPGATIKELMFRCGFTSRSSFYRHFSEQESMSPKEYLDRRNLAGGGNFAERNRPCGRDGRPGRPGRRAPEALRSRRDPNGSTPIRRVPSRHSPTTALNSHTKAVLFGDGFFLRSDEGQNR